LEPEAAVSKIAIRRAHQLSHAQATRAANSVAAQLKDQYSIQSRWSGDTLNFERAGAHGTVRLAPGELQLEVHLGMLLSVFRDTIAREIERNLDEHLAVAPKQTKQGRK
jgi:putative polyhydroxyalkanoate system protein